MYSVEKTAPMRPSREFGTRLEKKEVRCVVTGDPFSRSQHQLLRRTR